MTQTVFVSGSKDVKQIIVHMQLGLKVLIDFTYF